MHAVPTWDHRDPADFRAATKRDLLARYNTTSFVDVGIKTLKKFARKDGSSLFEAVDENGKSWWGRKVVLATGITDVFPDIEGYEDCWIKGIFHCLFCHGYEDRGVSSVGILAVDDCAPPKAAMHVANYALRLGDKVTIYTNGNDATTSALSSTVSSLRPDSKSAKNITINFKKISKLIKGSKGAEVEVLFEDGEKIVEGFLVHKPIGKLNGNWVEQLGLEPTEQGTIKVQFPFNETSVPGVFAVGDCGTVMQAVTQAIAMGGAAAAGVAAQLEAED